MDTPSINVESLEQRAADELRSASVVLAETRPKTTVAKALIEQLAAFGVRSAFGVSGGAIAVLFDAVLESSLGLCHFRHESGAVFAATEAYFASNDPVMVFTTTGPGLLNALTGLYAARGEGAKLVLVSGHTNGTHRGRGATQETSSFTMPQDYLYGRGPLFDLAVRVDHCDELSEVFRRIGNGLAAPGGFIAHISLPMAIQSSPVEQNILRLPAAIAAGPQQAVVEDCARWLREGSMAIWLGFGARKASVAIRELVSKTGAAVFHSPRAKGIVSERDPHVIGVTGLGGHSRVLQYMRDQRPQRILVLGTKLGEPTSFWDVDMLPCEGFIHVDLDPEVPGAAFPEFETLGVQAEIGAFVEAVLGQLTDNEPRRHSQARPLRTSNEYDYQPEGNVRPQAIMHALQKVVVDRTDAIVLAECGNSFAWCNQYLEFEESGRYRVSIFAGSMGHAATGVVGAAIATDNTALAVVGDGSMLMLSEVGTAVQYGAKAIWVVLNDAGYGMCRDGHGALGLCSDELSFSQRTDFSAWAKSMGAGAELVSTETQLEAALCRALAAQGPYVLDVIIDPTQPSPLVERFKSLIRQGSRKNVAGWEAKSTSDADAITFVRDSTPRPV